MKVGAITACGLGLVAFAVAGPCDSNCGRQVIGTAKASPALTARQSMCSDLLISTTTITPPVVTVSAPVVLNRNVHGPRAATVVTGEKPAYATACANVKAYWDACQCFGIVPTTVTVTAPAATQTLPAATCSQGVEFALYAVPAGSQRAADLQRAYDEGQLTIDLDLQSKGVQPDATGVTAYSGFEGAPDWGLPISIYGTSGPAGTSMGRSIVDHRGYIVPATAGVYTVYLDSADDALYAWVGDAAVSNWTPYNSNVRQFWPPTGMTSYQLTVEAVGKPIPFRLLWINEGGPGSFQVRIVDPAGNVILGPSSVKNAQVIASCSGKGGPVSAWAAWEQERI